MHHSSLPSPGLHIVHYSLWWVLWSLMRKQLVPVLGEAAVAWSVTASSPLNISHSLWKAAAAVSLLRTDPSSSPLSGVSVSAVPPPAPSQLWSHSASSSEKWGSRSQACLVRGRLLRRLGARGGPHQHPSLPLFLPIIDAVNVNKTVFSSTLTTLNSLFLIDFILYIFGYYSVHCKYLKLSPGSLSLTTSGT